MRNLVCGLGIAAEGGKPTCVGPALNTANEDALYWVSRRQMQAWRESEYW